MQKKQRTRWKVLRHPFFLHLLQAFCIFEPVSSEAPPPASKLTKASVFSAAGRRKSDPKTIAKLDIGGVI